MDKNEERIRNTTLVQLWNDAESPGRHRAPPLNVKTTGPRGRAHSTFASLTQVFGVPNYF